MQLYHHRKGSDEPIRCHHQLVVKESRPAIADCSWRPVQVASKWHPLHSSFHYALVRKSYHFLAIVLHHHSPHHLMIWMTNGRSSPIFRVHSGTLAEFSGHSRRREAQVLKPLEMEKLNEIEHQKW